MLNAEVNCRLLREEELPWFLSLLMGISYQEALSLSSEPNLAHSWVLGAWLRGILVGAVQIVPSVDPDSAVIVDTTVVPSMRGRGIGSLLHRERERFLVEKGRTKIVSAIAPWNGPSLNCSLNKSRCRGTWYLRDCYLKREDKLKIEKDILAPRDSADSISGGNVRVVEVIGKDEFLGSEARTGLERMINNEGYQVTKLVRKNNGLGYFLVLEGGD